MNDRTQTVLKGLEVLEQTVKRYRKYSAETRILMLVDKVRMLLGMAAVAFESARGDEIKMKIKDITDDDEINRIKEETNSTFDSIQNRVKIIEEEFDFLENYINDGKESMLSKLNEKLDHILYHPDSPEGIKLMESGKEEFIKLSSILKTEE